MPHAAPPAGPPGHAASNCPIAAPAPGPGPLFPLWLAGPSPAPRNLPPLLCHGLVGSSPTGPSPSGPRRPCPPGPFIPRRQARGRPLHAPPPSPSYPSARPSGTMELESRSGRQCQPFFVTRKHRFFFFSREPNEPPRIHVEAGEGYAKFWLNSVALANFVGFRAHELRRIEEIVEENAETFRRAWDEHFQR